MKYLKRLNKRVKGFNDFMKMIKESIDFWEDVDTADLNEYLQELIDNGYHISIENGFVDAKEDVDLDKKEEGNPNQLKLFNDDVEGEILGDPYSFKLEDDYYVINIGPLFPSIRITIEESNIRNVSDEDLTHVLKFFKKIVKNDYDMYTEIMVDDVRVDYDDVVIKNGEFITKDRDNENEFDSLELILIPKKPIDMKMVDVAKYYDWSFDKSDDNGDIYFNVDYTDMVDMMINNSELEDQLLNGVDLEASTDDYDCDTESLIRYNLKKEDEITLARCVIRELGGIDNIDNENLTGMTEDVAVDFLVSERYHRTLCEIAEDTEVCGELNSLFGEHAFYAHEEACQKDLDAAFEDIVDKHFTSTKANGVYTIKFDSEWIDDLSRHGSDYFKNETLESIMKEWFLDTEGRYDDLNVRYSDYGTVDKDEFSKQANEIMKKYL
jgi:hypothetical protein